MPGTSGLAVLPQGGRRCDWSVSGSERRKPTLAPSAALSAFSDALAQDTHIIPLRRRL